MAPKTENGHQKTSRWGLFWTHFGAQTKKKTYKKLHDFLVTILIDLCSVFNLILKPFGAQNRDRKRKREHMKIELSLRREPNFQGLGPSQTINKPIKNAA